MGGAPRQLITIAGAGFRQGVMILARRFGSGDPQVDLPTTYLSPTQVQMTVPRRFIQAPGLVELTACNPDGMQAAPLNLSVRVPSIASLTPMVPANQNAQLTIRAVGISRFDDGSRQTGVQIDTKSDE